MTRLYTSTKHPQHWIASVPGSGWMIFPALDQGWEKRRPAKGLDPMYVREVPLGLAFNTGLIEAARESAAAKAA